jgi:hypothetical protein
MRSGTFNNNNNNNNNNNIGEYFPAETEKWDIQ